mmetsp:Transcript_23798/g.31115  ORF Transcript_23798/g.31115 Transcript_23798/m.31115 type:complete len:200 (-) Transcript_23798:119-718(-)
MGQLLCCFPTSNSVDSSIEVRGKDVGTKKQEVLHDKSGNIVDETGARIFSKAYYEYRDEAKRCAEQRSHCFQQSSKAFEEGKKGEAKQLSNEGKEFGKKMEVANQKAVDELLKTQQDLKIGKLDLHGMYVKEAIQATENFINLVTKDAKLSQLEIVTGIGNHSQNHQAKIKPEIVSLLQKRNLKYQAEDHNDGAFIVSI